MTNTERAIATGRNGETIPSRSLPAPDRIATAPSSHRPYRLAILASHPIQYQAPLFRRLAADPDIDIEIFFCSEAGAVEYWDAGFGRQVRWDVPVREGYASTVLPNRSPRRDRKGFLGLLNPSIVRVLSQEDFDAVMVHSWARATDWICLLTAVAFGIPVLLRAETSSLAATAPWKSALKRVILRGLFHRVHGFLATGSYGAQFYRDHGVEPERVFIMPYAVDNDFFFATARQVESEGSSARNIVGIPDGVPLVLFSGKLIERKRPVDLLRAFGRARQDVEAALIFVGDGELRPVLESIARAEGIKDVHFVGFQNQTELPRFYAAADLMVLPSAFETWGLVVNEAMCFGLPVLATDQVGATGDLVRHGVNGFVYPVGDVEALTDHLRVLFTDPILRMHMGSASRELIAGWDYEADLRTVKRCLAAVVRARHIGRWGERA